MSDGDDFIDNIIVMQSTALAIRWMMWATGHTSRAHRSAAANGGGSSVGVARQVRMQLACKFLG
ncbi:MAG: hypothetical protein U1G07_13625 [Verrucomicrobiota bacterium]